MVLVEFRAEHDASALWEGVSERVVELLPIVPLGEGTAPLVAVEDDAPDGRAAALRSYPNVASVDPVTEHDARSVFRVTWSGVPIRGLAFDGPEGHLLRAVGRADGWDLTVLFDGQGSLTSFWETTHGGEVPVTVERIRTSGYPESASATVSAALSDQQRETLRRAVERGYYDVPRRCTLGDLASEFDVSDQAVSERLRRGTKLLVGDALAVDIE